VTTRDFPASEDVPATSSPDAPEEVRRAAARLTV
jgi:hypothetical protein